MLSLLLALFVQNSDLEFIEVKFFEGGKTLSKLGERTYARQFNRTTTRYVVSEVSSKNLKSGIADQTVTLSMKYFRPDGSLFGEPKMDYKVPKDWKEATLWKGWGWEEPGNWTEGTYTVEIWYDGKKKVGTATFVIVDDRPEHIKKAERARNDAEASIVKKDFEGAVRELTRALDLNPDVAEVHARRAFCYNNLGKLDKAIDDAKRATQLSPKTASYWTVRAKYQERSGDDEGAMITYSLAIEMNPKEASFYRSRSDFYLLRGECAKAIADINKAIELQPTYTWYVQDRARIQIVAGNFDAALADFQASKASANQIAEMYLAKGDAEAAIAAFGTPATADAYSYRARIHTYLRQYDKALADYTKAWELKADDNYGYNKGLVLTMTGDYEAAIAFFKMGAEKVPPPSYGGHNYAHSNMLQSLAHAQHLNGQKTEALETMDKMVSLYPKYTFGYGVRARHKILMGDNDGARKDLEDCARTDDPVNPASHRIYVWMMLGDWSTALKEIVDYQNRATDRWREDWYKALKWVNRCKLGDRKLADQELEEYLTRTQKFRKGTLSRSWPLFLAGKTSEEQFIKDAEAFDPRLRDIEASGAYYFAGVKRWVDGDKDGAKNWFVKCRATSSWFKYDLQDFPDLAWMELLAMGEVKVEAPKAKPKPAVGGQAVIVTKDGSTYKGRIESEDDTTIRIRTAMSVFNLKKSDIDRIDR